MTLEQLHRLYLEHPNICTDTRKISADCLFFALKGDNFNGNEFAERALENGAAYAIIDQERYKASDRYILCDNVLETLQKLASHHRAHCSAKLVALTGSNGKTTTKELIHAVLSKKYRTVATKGNLNNHIGVPLTLLSIGEDTEMAIVEMGANHKGEIAFLSEIARADFGYITNFGKAHLEGFGSMQGVIEAKSELYGHLMAHEKHIFMNADDPIQVEKLNGYIKKIGFSTQDHQYFNIRLIKADPFVVLEVEGTEIETQLIGRYNFPNCCAAILMGTYFDVPLGDIKNALEGYRPQNNRSQIMTIKGIEIILDAYNANPSSMNAALENFHRLRAGSKTLILGDMFELGEAAELEHQALADRAAELGFTEVHLVGEHFFATNTHFKRFKTFDALKDYLNENPIGKGSLLIKGSRGMALERVLDIL